jgi:hypothetical protein
MEYNFEYNHSRLSLVQLQKSGIRSIRQLEEVIEWEHAVCIEYTGYGYPLYRFVGLTMGCLGLEVAVTIDEAGKFITLDAMIAEREEFHQTMYSAKM